VKTGARVVWCFPLDMALPVLYKNMAYALYVSLCLLEVIYATQ